MRCARRQPFCWLLIVTLGGLLSLLSLPGPGQAEPDRASFVPPERDRLRLLTRARQLLDEKRYSEAVKGLGEVLDSAEDGVLPSPGGEDEPVRFLKAEAVKIISALPAEGRQAYHREYAAGAQRALDAAVKAGDVSGIERVAGQFFHTPAGYEATSLLANVHLDHHRALAAALCFERLRETPDAAKTREPLLSFKTAAAWFWAGKPERAQQTLVELKQRSPKGRLLVGGKEVALFSQDAQALLWLASAVGVQASAETAASDEWRMFRGNAARNATNAGSRPLLNPRWQIHSSYEPAVRQNVADLKQSFVDQNLTALPGLHPLIVNDGKRDVVLFRTTLNLLAADFATGKRIWEVPVDETEPQQPNLDANGQSSNPQQVFQALEERLWDDAAYGTLSSDGANVYAIEDLTSGPSGTPVNRRMVILPNGLRRDPSPRVYNRLAAYELKSEGKLRWALGGPAGPEQLPEAETFFLGPPLPAAGRLYVLAESKSQIRLLAIDPQKDPLKGESLVEWSQAIADLNKDITASQVDNRLRRLAGVSPSYADGVLVCPTAAGTVAAVDLATRALRWGYAYQNDAEVEHRSRLEAHSRGAAAGPGDGDDHWVGATATLAEGSVLLTPPDSRDLHCVSLADGRKLWTVPRLDGLYLACAQDGKALIIGRNAVRAVKLADGSPAWTSASVALPSGGMPSGAGYYHAGRYYLPLTTAEVAAIDLATGEIDRSASPRGSVPGNLVCYKGAVLSQGADVLERFEQVSVQRERVARKLAENPDDAIALVEQAEILLDGDKLPAAIASLKQALSLDPQGRSRELLVESLLEALRRDFAANRKWLPELAPLVRSPREQAAYHRMLAQGLHSVGETLPALEAYLKIVDGAGESPSLDRLEQVHSVRQDRWLQARLPALRTQATAADRAKIDAAVQSRFDRAAAADSEPSLRRFVQYFDGFPLADRARLLLARRLAKAPTKSLLEREVLLRMVEESDVPEWSREAVARLASLESEAGRPRVALRYYERLAGELANEVCLDGQTGKQIVEKLAADSPLRVQLARTQVWPTGVVDIKPQPSVNARNRNTLFDLVGSEPLRDLRLELEQQTAQLVATDSLGGPLWTLPLREAGQRGMYSYLSAVPQARVRGNFLAVALQNQVFAIDGLGDGKGTPRLLWKQNLSETLPGLASNTDNQENQLFIRGVVFSSSYGAPQPVLGPVTGRQIVFQRVRNLVALDVLSGQTLWVRQNIPLQSVLFGDDEFIFCVPPDSGGQRALVFRAADGHLLGERAIPASEQTIGPAQGRLITSGRHVLLSSIEGDKRIVRLFDPWHQKNVWQAAPLSPAAKCFVWQQEVVALMEPDGRVQLVNLADGRTLIDEKVEPVTITQPDKTTRISLAEIYLLGSRDHFVLVANSVSQHDMAVNNVQPVPHSYTHPMNPRVHGRVYGFDRVSGKKLWTVEVARQGVLLEQPSELPIVFFAASSYEPNQQVPGRSPTLGLLCLDKRTGRTIHAKTSSAGTLSHFDLVGDPDKQTVDLKAPRESIRMTFTNQPLPEPAAGEAAKPPVKAGAEKQSSLLKPLLNAIIRAQEAKP